MKNIPTRAAALVDRSIAILIRSTAPLIRATIVLGLLVVATIVRGQQRPSHLQVNSLLDQVPVAQSSSACYSVCTVTKDESGTSTVRDNGPTFNRLQEQLKSMMSADMSAMQASSANAGAPAAPTAEQIAQMQQDAMARAQALSQGGANPSAAMEAQAQANRRPPSVNPALMKEMNNAQMAAMKIRTLVNELAGKVGAINKRHVPSEPNCPDVQQGGYAGPTCACTKARLITGEQKEVGAEDERLQAQVAIFRPYLSDIKEQVAIIDKMESDAKYGEGITDPTQLQLLWMAQHQALGGFTSLLGIAGGIWKDGADQYVRLVNAKVYPCK